MKNTEYQITTQNRQNRVSALFDRLSKLFATNQLTVNDNQVDVRVGKVSYNLFPISDDLITLVATVEGASPVEMQGLTPEVVERMLTSKISAHGDAAPSHTLGNAIERQDESWETATPGTPKEPVSPEPPLSPDFPPTGESFETAQDFATNLKNLFCRGQVSVTRNRVIVRASGNVIAVVTKQADGMWLIRVFLGKNLITDMGGNTRQQATGYLLNLCITMDDKRHEFLNRRVEGTDETEDEEQTYWEFVKEMEAKLGKSTDILKNKSLYDLSALGEQPSLGLSKSAQLQEGVNQPAQPKINPSMHGGLPVSLNEHKDPAKPYQNSLVPHLDENGKIQIVDKSTIPLKPKWSIDPSNGHVHLIPGGEKVVKPQDTPHKFRGHPDHATRGLLERLRRNAGLK